MNVAFLKGKLNLGSDEVIVVAGGIGLQIECGFNVEDVPLIDEVEFFVRTIFREDGIKHYAFLNAFDRMFFDRIVAVDGCGPAMALRIVKTDGADDMIRRCDVKSLVKIKGVGLKTAEKLCTEIASSK